MSGSEMLDYDLARERLRVKGEQYKKHLVVFKLVRDIHSMVTKHENAASNPQLQEALRKLMLQRAAALDTFVTNL